ncbi:MAG TPA: hypothetical protein DD392_08020 [Ruminococcus sp.]|nr:hypothetical protein [Ruminococcus sp.]
MFKIDNTEFKRSNYDESTADTVKDFTMENGDVVRYVNKKSVVSLNCKIFLKKSEMENLKNIFNGNTEHIVNYGCESEHTLYMFADSISYKRISDEYWEASFTLKECRRAT